MRLMTAIVISLLLASCSVLPDYSNQIIVVGKNKVVNLDSLTNEGLSYLDLSKANGIVFF